MIRDYRKEDKAALEAIHKAVGLDYQFPDLDHPLFFVRKVLQVGDSLRAALVLKICAETMLLIDPQQEPQEKLTEMQELQSSVLSEAYHKGLDDVYAAIPPIGFDKRLIQLGWKPDRPEWKLWSRSTHAISNESGR